MRTEAHIHVQTFQLPCGAEGTISATLVDERLLVKTLGICDIRARGSAALSLQVRQRDSREPRALYMTARVRIARGEPS